MRYTKIHREVIIFFIDFYIVCVELNRVAFLVAVNKKVLCVHHQLKCTS